LSGSGIGLNNAIARLSSGLRVNSAKDDAAGLAIAERMNAQVKGFDVAARNANDGISMLQVADGAMGKLSDNLQRMRELAVQAKNGTLNTTDRVNLNREYTELANEVDRITAGTTFNGNAVFSAANKTVSFQVGTGNATGDTLSLNLTDDGLAGGNDLTTVLTNGAASIQANLGNVDTVANATTAITNIDAALDDITGIRAVVGAGQSRLEQVAAFAETSSTNLQAARGRIMDADFAKETAALTRAQILQQAGTAMLAQANQLPNNVLSLLQ
uniref:flagellin N-terminal helical domain-containing protein n=1 Tax=Limnobacter sp. TaxID=2003368 RepID=UPI0035182A7D